MNSLIRFHLHVICWTYFYCCRWHFFYQYIYCNHFIAQVYISMSWFMHYYLIISHVLLWVTDRYFTIAAWWKTHISTHIFRTMKLKLKYFSLTWHREITELIIHPWLNTWRYLDFSKLSWKTPRIMSLLQHNNANKYYIIKCISM